MVEIDITYDGELHTTCIHGPSGVQLATDAPRDNHGRGESFSPTDLLATALGSCMATVMGILARSRGYALEGTKIHVVKEMTKTPPRRVDRLTVTVTVPSAGAAGISVPARGELERTAHDCPVRLSLLPSIEVPVTFEWDG